VRLLRPLSSSSEQYHETVLHVDQSDKTGKRMIGVSNRARWEKIEGAHDRESEQVMNVFSSCMFFKMHAAH